MRRINSEEQLVIDRQPLCRSMTFGVEKQRRISSVGVEVHLLTSRLDAACLAIPEKENLAIGKLRDGLLMLTQFSPDDLAIAVVIELEDEIKIA